MLNSKLRNENGVEVRFVPYELLRSSPQSSNVEAWLRLRNNSETPLELYRRRSGGELVRCGDIKPNAAFLHHTEIGHAFIVRDSITRNSVTSFLIETVVAKASITLADVEKANEPLIKFVSYEDLKSKNSNVVAWLRIENYSETPLELAWISYEGKFPSYGKIEPKEERLQQTEIGHSWIVRDFVTKNIVTSFEIEEQRAKAVIWPWEVTYANDRVELAQDIKKLNDAEQDYEQKKDKVPKPPSKFGKVLSFLLGLITHGVSKLVTVPYGMYKASKRMKTKKLANGARLQLADLYYKMEDEWEKKDKFDRQPFFTALQRNKPQDILSREEWSSNLSKVMRKIKDKKGDFVHCVNQEWAAIGLAHTLFKLLCETVGMEELYEAIVEFGWDVISDVLIEVIWG